MPIRFHCDRCGQRLGIARRKAGAEIACPTCGKSQLVPADASVDRIEEIEPDSIEEEGREAVMESVPDLQTAPDDEIEPETFEIELPAGRPPLIPAGVDLSNTIDLTFLPEASPVTPASTPPPVTAQADAETSEVLPQLPVPWSVYAQALLLLGSVIGAFASGYYLGHQDGSVADTNSPPQEVTVQAASGDGFAEEEVLLEGRIRWMPHLGEAAGDDGAVLIALLEEPIPRERLPIAGLRPGSESREAFKTSAAAIRSAGGVFARADVSGTIAAVLPREGRYHLLLISRHVLRLENQPIHAKDLMEMKQFFAEPEELIGPNRYVWLADEIRVGFPVVEHDFGLDGL
jgi:hypothetical protein